MLIESKEPDPLTQEESLRWFRLLKLSAGDHVKPITTLLKVTQQTWYKWQTSAPTEWWRREVYRVILELQVNRMRRIIVTTKAQWKIDGLKTRVKKIEEGLSDLPSERYFTAQANSTHSPQFRLARQLLRRHMKPGKKHPAMDLITLARQQGLSTRTLANAAGDLGVEKGRDGYQGHAWWRLPVREEDDE